MTLFIDIIAGGNWDHHNEFELAKIADCFEVNILTL